MSHIAHHSHFDHQNVRKNYPLLTKLVLIMSIAEPLMTLPQIYKIWVQKETAGISLATWAFFTFAAVIWFFYGLKLKNIPILVSSTLWAILQGSIVIGLLIY